MSSNKINRIGNPIESNESNESNESKDIIAVLPIEELPKEYQVIHQEFQDLLHAKNPKGARLALRKLIAYYIDNSKEIPVSIEVGYGKLLMLEEIEKNKSSK